MCNVARFSQTTLGHVTFSLKPSRKGGHFHGDFDLTDYLVYIYICDWKYIIRHQAHISHCKLLASGFRTMQGQLKAGAPGTGNNRDLEKYRASAGVGNFAAQQEKNARVFISLGTEKQATRGARVYSSIVLQQCMYEHNKSRCPFFSLFLFPFSLLFQ